MRSLSVLLVLSLVSAIALTTSPAWADPTTRAGRPFGPIETDGLRVQAESPGDAETDAELRSRIASLLERGEARAFAGVEF